METMKEGFSNQFNWFHEMFRIFSFPAFFGLFPCSLLWVMDDNLSLLDYAFDNQIDVSALFVSCMRAVVVVVVVVDSCLTSSIEMDKRVRKILVILSQ